MCEMKRAHDFRVDEFSTKLRESHDTMQRLTSQIQELQESVNSMSWPDKFQETESNYSGIISHVFSQCTVIPSTRSLLSRDRRHLIHGICLNHRGRFSAIHALCSIHHRYLVKGILHSTTLQEVHCIFEDEDPGRERASHTNYALYPCVIATAK